MKTLMQWLMVAAALLLAAGAAQAAIDPAKVQKLLADDGAAGDLFGSRVAIDGDTAVIGAHYDDSSGSAYVFVRSANGTWSQQAKLTANDRADGDVFGSSVAVSGDTAVIGAPSDNYSGSAYIFIRSANGTWSQQAKLTADDGATGDLFGFSVSMSGDTAVIGAYGNGYNSGAAYVFVRSANGTWSQQAKLTANDGAFEDMFGISVAVVEDTVVIGAVGGDGKSDDSGAAYVFVRATDTWIQQAKLTADDGAFGDCFGSSVALSGDTAVIGAGCWDPLMGKLSGSAYVFVRAAGGAWSQQAKLTVADGAADDYFGWSVSVSEDTAVIGAYGDDDKGYNSGSVYVFSGHPVVAPVKMNMAPVYKLLLKR